MKNTLFLAILLFSFVGVYAQKTLSPVDTDSKIHFVIKNIGINTGGDFSGLQGTIKFDENNAAASSVDVSVQTKTVDTDNDRRDGHLKNEDYFEVEKYPAIRLVSTSIAPTNTKGTYQLTGNLTIKAVTKKVSFPFTVTPSNGGYLFAGNFIINRLDYGVGKESATMSNDVKIELTVAAK